MKPTLTDEDKAALAEASAAVEAASLALAEAIAARHALWVRYVRGGASRTEVARASGVIRQAVGYALSKKR